METKAYCCQRLDCISLLRMMSSNCIIHTNILGLAPYKHPPADKLGWRWRQRPAADQHQANGTHLHHNGDRSFPAGYVTQNVANSYVHFWWRGLHFRPCSEHTIGTRICTKNINYCKPYNHSSPTCFLGPPDNAYRGYGIIPSMI